MFTDNVFGTTQRLLIPTNCDIVFVSDMFVEDYVGGAELTSEALIKSSPFNVFKLHARDVSLDTLQQGQNKFWIFGNFASMDYKLIPSVVANIKYAILEYDYKFCKFRSVEKHLISTGTECDCDNDIHGKIVSTLFCGAKSIWWMSEKQKQLYTSKFSFLTQHKNSTVLSSVFDLVTLDTLKQLKNNTKNNKWTVLGSESWIKGAQQAKDWCTLNKKEPDIIWGLGYQDTLQKLSTSCGFVYLPVGGDTCPRMVIEAKLLGCKLHLNEHVQHKNETWFSTDDLEQIDQYLRNTHEKFWNGIKKNIHDKKTISGYTTTKNCIKQKYPFIESINSMLGFCDEVIVVDGGSTDGTWQALEVLAQKNIKLKVHLNERDWEHKRFAVFDGEQKAYARKLCTSDFCWQMDSDEIVHENDYEKITNIINNFPANNNLLALPVIEYWGSTNKVRCDINPWKWRLSRNMLHITHGIPSGLRKTDSNGDTYASLGTDGCDYVHSVTGEMIPFMTFCDNNVNQLKQYVHDVPEALTKYNTWFNNAINELPGVFHYSWFNIERKILTYKNYWSKHWQSLFDIEQIDTAENNMFFNKSWATVNEQDIKELALKLKNDMGGWIFHRKINFNEKTKHIMCNKTQPACMENWTKDNVTK